MIPVAEGYTRLFAYPDEAGNSLRFCWELAGEGTNADFWENAVFGFEFHSERTAGSVVSLRCNRGMTNSIYAGETWPTGMLIDGISGFDANSFYYEPKTMNIGWHVSVSPPGAKLPDLAWIDGPTPTGGPPDPPPPLASVGGWTVGRIGWIGAPVEVEGGGEQ